jgi:hypothetical protein
MSFSVWIFKLGKFYKTLFLRIMIITCCDITSHHITLHYLLYVSSDPTKSSAWSFPTVCKPRLMSQVGRAHEFVCLYISVFLQLEWWRCQYSCWSFREYIGSENMSRMPPGLFRSTRWSVLSTFYSSNK